MTYSEQDRMVLSLLLMVPAGMSVFLRDRADPCWAGQGDR